MNFDKLANILGAIVTVALVATVLGSPNTAGVIRAFGDSFAHSIAAAQARAS